MQYETIRIGYQKATVKVLIDVAQRLGIAKTGVKRKLFDRIRDSTHVVKVDDDSFDYQREIIPGEVFPTWIILTPEPVPVVPGIDMATGAQTGFFGPTNKENAVGGVRQNFITQDGERIVRLELRESMRTKSTLVFMKRRRNCIPRVYLQSGRICSSLRSWCMTSSYPDRQEGTLTCSEAWMTPHLQPRLGQHVLYPCMDQ